MHLAKTDWKTNGARASATLSRHVKLARRALRLSDCLLLGVLDHRIRLAKALGKNANSVLVDLDVCDGCRFGIYSGRYYETHNQLQCLTMNRLDIAADCVAIVDFLFYKKTLLGAMVAQHTNAITLVVGARDLLLGVIVARRRRSADQLLVLWFDA